VGLGQQERAEGASGRVEAFGTLPQPGEYVLDHLLGQPADRQHPEGDVEQAAAVASVELGERLLIVPLDRRHEEAIVCALGASHRRWGRSGASSHNAGQWTNGAGHGVGRGVHWQGDAR